ncbi:AraC family transcriptional regulator [Streptococcus gallolyticus]|uniref:AraC family transcriptional regulator n=1 Tax=Streptococcus gallolyticus TaxID=315405 RepID=A0A368UCL9_9STRE|nr:response regulator transcription factor [Streptococcus gallolyticus]RCW16698.1 AraC family transcriptional regulator [Streptococcus gallolyticus]
MENFQHEVINPNQSLLSFLRVHNEQSDAYIAPHWHRAIELSYTKKGSIDHFYIKGENFQTEAGRILLVNTQEVHSIRVLKYKKEAEVALTIIYPYPFLVGQFQHMDDYHFEINHPETFSKQQQQAYQNLQSLLEKIILDYQKDSPQKNLKLNLGILQVLDILLDFFLVKNKVTGYNDNRLQVAERILAIDAFLQNHYQENIGLEELADYCHLSRSYMARFFKIHLGVTLRQYLGTIRAQKARNCLIETMDSFTDIALEQGFSGLRSMNRALETNFGKNARQIRSHES